jgi:ATP-dependent RNA helicase DeaD
MIQNSGHPFASFGLSNEVLDALTRKGFTAPSAIQAIALPRLLAAEGHLVVKARTGTGKTAAFGIPLVEWLTERSHTPRALVLTPTRELALQVSGEIASLASGPFPRITVVYGGSSIRNQIHDLKRGTEIVVGTPGRIMDLMDRKVLDLSAVDWFILDEADEMLDMGFFEDVETILQALKPERRVALFSATMPETILKVIRKHIGDVDILEDAAPADEKPAVDQYYMVLKREDRLEALRRIVDGADTFYGLVFCATKAGADELAKRLTERGYSAEAIHGDLSQEARERTLDRFRSRFTRILVATDVAARGIDVEGLSHVINWDLPGNRESYVHRIGRTGRAGRRGTAVSLILPGDRGRLSHLSRSMEHTLGSKIQWMKPPSVKSVMAALRERIIASVAAALPETALPRGAPDPETAEASAALSGSGGPPGGAGENPELPEAGNAAAVPVAGAGIQPGHAGANAGGAAAVKALSGELIARLGGEGAVEALVSLSYGAMLDPARYDPITEIESGANVGGVHAGEKRPDRFKGKRDRFDEGRPHSTHPGSRHPDRGGAVSRVYVGIGRHHGVSARDVAGLLMRAGGVPGRLVDAIEVKDYCAFATLPEDAARRACAFSRNTPEDPVIKPAAGRDQGRRK